MYKLINKSAIVLMILSMVMLSGCSSGGRLTADVKPASEYTSDINAKTFRLLDFEDETEAKFAVKGFIDAPKKLEIKNSDGDVIWSQSAFDFIRENSGAPASVNPSLWENSSQNGTFGLFEVTEGIYQVRGYDMANLTVVEGKEGRIIVDPLMSVECCRAAMELVEKNLGKKDIKAVIISHPHVDHFGGIKGVVNEDQIADSAFDLTNQMKSGKIPVIVPDGFAENAMSENIYVGKAMARRSEYQYGTLLNPSETGRVGIGIGMGQSNGTVSYINPTYVVKTDAEKVTLDGVEIEFQLTPGTEAASEMNMWFPQKKALWLAENCAATLHNLYTINGSKIRDGRVWAEYLIDSLSRYGSEVEVAFQSHNWPHWGNKTVVEYMENTAAVYKYITDQTLTYINQGYTSDEIAGRIKLPEAFEKIWYTRQNYGTVAQNAKAVYQNYMGWYDGNPVNLNPLAPSESAKKWVEYLGDISEVMEKAREDYAKGEYRWVAEITNVLVYANPRNKAARYLCADALEQLGYQAESGVWRNAYLSAAAELRNGTNPQEVADQSGDMVQNMTAEMIFDYMAIKLNKQNLANEDFKVNFAVTDTAKNYSVHFKSGVMLVYEDTLSPDATLTLTCTKNDLLLILDGEYEEAVSRINMDGDRRKFEIIIDNLNELDAIPGGKFNIVEP